MSSEQGRTKNSTATIAQIRVPQVPKLVTAQDIRCDSIPLEILSPSCWETSLARSKAMMNAKYLSTVFFRKSIGKRLDALGDLLNVITPVYHPRWKIQGPSVRVVVDSATTKLRYLR